MPVKTPQFSVVIPAYNAARWLGETLQSWACQTVREFEVIVVDDGSQDATIAVARAFQPQLNLRIIDEPHSGAPAHPCNVGILAAQGELIVQCDADDMAMPDRLEAIQYAWDAAGRRDCLIFSDFSHIDASGSGLRTGLLADYSALERVQLERLRDDVGLLSLDSGFSALLEGSFIRPCSAAFPKRVFAHVGGFNEALRNGQDFDLYVRIARKYPLVWLNRILGLYRIVPDSISARSAIELAPSRLMVFSRLLGLPLTPRQAGVVRRWLAANYETLGYEYGNRGEVRRSLEAYCQAFVHRPALGQFKGMAASVAKALTKSQPRSR